MTIYECIDRTRPNRLGCACMLCHQHFHAWFILECNLGNFYGVSSNPCCAYTLDVRKGVRMVSKERSITWPISQSIRSSDRSINGVEETLENCLKFLFRETFSNHTFLTHCIYETRLLKTRVRKIVSRENKYIKVYLSSYNTFRCINLFSLSLKQYNLNVHLTCANYAM